MRPVAIVVERFNNLCHHHVSSEPPRRGDWHTLADLYSDCIAAYGPFTSLHYRDLGDVPAVPVGWIFQQPAFRGPIETWVSVLDVDTLRYLDIRTIDDDAASDPTVSAAPSSA